MDEILRPILTDEYHASDRDVCGWAYQAMKAKKVAAAPAMKAMKAKRVAAVPAMKAMKA